MLDIIIPAYNAHETINNCLFSILNQNKTKKIKVYLIDDCSDITYEKEYNFFKDKLDLTLIRLEKNSGPGVARQVGLDNSNSDYVLFLDSDDVLYDSYSITNIMKYTKSKKYDVIISNMIEKYKGEIRTYYSAFDTLHSKLYKRTFIEKNNIVFPETYNSEDVAFNNLVLINDPKIAFCEELVYTYRRRKNSLTMTDDYYKKKHIKFFSKNLIWVIKKAEKDGVREKNIGSILSFSLAYLYYYFTMKSNMKDKNLYYLSDIIEYYEKYKKYINKKEEKNNIIMWFSNRDKIQYEVSYNEFINLCKKVKK